MESIQYNSGIPCTGNASITRVNCSNISITTPSPTQGSTSQLEWQVLCDYIVFYANPILIGFGLFFAIFNTIVVMSHARISNDSYMMGLTISTAIMYICNGMLHFPDYVGYSEAFQHVFVYILGGGEWFAYTALWLIVMAALERCVNMMRHQGDTLCTSLQACITTIMIYMVCFVSTLPRYWEYEVGPTVDPATNNTFRKVMKSAAASGPEYSVYYFWYILSFKLLLPFPLMLIMTIILCQRIGHYRKRKIPSYRRDSTLILLNRKLKEEIDISRLALGLLVTYLLLAGPYVIITAIPEVFPEALDKTSTLYSILFNFSQCSYYLNFSLQVILFSCYSKSYRIAVARLCCDRCRNPDYEDY
ncbi:uncharacterized protein LOC106153595 [Lingula anatina]|uniref:Uncharacterized protein LOC106153595 n=1 Tax=Lingula anatina TaxID=7574 RepID=A0A1S3HAK7_LINAN|nr:uncharacterized protein LOC106153595 [Lingula anatina]XP_013383035.1 uncharacterized protein LOC106153595 [Lingula anatina]XP_013383036.1 uncharacterized protein LOC106153595 [Lingula anatina]XP_013383037.1 uncharacterized protein LOC106153595 [Lingula anatina]XP_013383038.1 uncharacterized protein LOC106153595 [Lingula anatina]XP_013383039.1 uncharacterized protein LOC106153595 [Lingula anatina]|eukprot:XP_013383034.1 uncharacterized protein LOC106153595 [Lingula anatina]